VNAALARSSIASLAGRNDQLSAAIARASGRPSFFMRMVRIGAACHISRDAGPTLTDIVVVFRRLTMFRYDRRSCPGTLWLSIPAAMLAALLATSLPAAAAGDCRHEIGPSVDWHDCNKSMLMFEGSDLSGANLAGTDLTSTDLRGANLAGANLEKATLVRASLAGANADKANFARVEGFRTSFAETSAKDASFASAELQRSDFSKAQLTGADFEKAELGRVNFSEATITGTKFKLANLSRAEFYGAVFEGPIDFDRAFLYLTRFEGMDLSAATGLAQWQVDLSCGDDKTKLPKGLNVPKAWPCKFTND
jgi:uncharacterized protein YjbI with pentapeptide repeats